MPQNSTKSNIHQLDLLDEKRAFVVIALTDKLSRHGKAAAFNCFAHYNSIYGYSWASVPTMAKESGYAPTSKKGIQIGLDEIAAAGAFKVVKTKGGGNGETHRACPIMSWFRDEYEYLRRSGVVANDNEEEFADIHNLNLSGANNTTDDEKNSGQWSKKHKSVEQKAPVSGANNSTKRTDEENREKRTNINEQNETKNASGGGPAVSSKPKVANDNERSSWPENDVEQFVDAFTIKAGDGDKIADELDKARSEGVLFTTILAGATEYSRAMKLRGKDGRQYAKRPENWLKGRCWGQYQPESQTEKHARIKAKVKVAI